MPRFKRARRSADNHDSSVVASCSSPPGTDLCAFSGSFGTRFFLHAEPALGSPTAPRVDALKLIPFSPEHLRLDATLPFGVRDASGRLLLAAGAQIASAEQLAQLRAQPLFADEEESNEWRRQLGRRRWARCCGRTRR